MPLDMDSFARWTAGYAKACEQNDAAAAAALFSEDAVYYTTPFDQPWDGRSEIEANWGEDDEVLEGFECRCDPIAVTGNVGVARWWAIYPSTGMEFSSVFVVTFADGERASEFREWYMSREVVE
ncbi:MAG TPA: nuclear transport factor 2 family protein [Actinomycetota bacterium]|nr:nuclear transport factor 2 family protein [Actinomycetota bacterium]